LVGAWRWIYVITATFILIGLIAVAKFRPITVVRV